MSSRPDMIEEDLRAGLAVDSADTNSHLRAIAEFARRHQLSQREHQVLLSASFGSSSKETAAALKCSRHTVDEYWSRIFRKTECRSQTSVMARVLRDQCGMSGTWGRDPQTPGA